MPTIQLAVTTDDSALQRHASRAELLRSKSLLILDLDGVVYAGHRPIEGAVEAISAFRRLGKRVAFLTNNSARSAQGVCEKLRSFGLECERRELITSSEAAALFLREKGLDRGCGVFVIGTNELEQELAAAGIRSADPESCGAVLLGLDPEFTYRQISMGLKALLRGVPFIACNRDANYPSARGEILPGCGAMVGALEAASSRKADHVVGKPEAFMLEILLSRLGVCREESIVFGDSLDSDILMAKRAGVACVWISDGDVRLSHTPSAELTADVTVRSLSEIVPDLMT